mmetsp:Transcript_5695/g.7372  ORF Transcript_5695/g.7372 Transcript_5695/m.7372 type:complete len:166 (-) Transcript_5695:2059-2556(-)
MRKSFCKWGMKYSFLTIWMFHPLPLSPSIEKRTPFSYNIDTKFDRTEGILETIVGYSGSSNPTEYTNPTYKSIHDYAESIRITFDCNKVSYENVLDMFFAFHTPANPSWAGTQYRSAIFVYNEEQRLLAEECVKSWGALGKYVSVEDASDFYRAEEYHQKYLEKF